MNCISFFKCYYGGSFLSNFQAIFASGFPDRSISATETIGRIVEKFEHLMEDTFSFILFRSTTSFERQIKRQLNNIETIRQVHSILKVKFHG
jgi:hypothetical protein